MTYLPRAADKRLAELLLGSRAISIEGPRGCGKTRTALQIAQTVVEMDDPGARAALQADRRGILASMQAPVLVDEWQLDPPVWDAVRRLVDTEGVPGRFVLTGSADPGESSLHSGAGRFARLRMRPMALCERGLTEPTVSMADLWAGDAKLSGSSPVALADYVEQIVGSGLPGVLREPIGQRQSAVRDYVDYLMSHEIGVHGGHMRRPQSLRAWLRAYAAATGSTASQEAISLAVDRDSMPSRKTITEFRDTLERLWLLDPVPAWQLGVPRLNQLGSAPKHHLADPALAATLLGANATNLLRASGPGDAEPGLRNLHHGPLLGALFESLVTLSVRTLADTLGLEVSHLRTHRGQREIDLVIHSADGRAIACEVKLSPDVDDHDVRHLHWLRNEMGDLLIDRIVVTTGTYAYRRPDGVAVIPLALLGP